MAVFGWCNTGQHEACMVSNAGSTCQCPCANHGANYAAPVDTKEEQTLRNIANKVLANDVVAKANKIDLRRKNNEPVMTYEEALESIGVGKVKGKKPDATTIEELKLSR